MVDQDSRKGLVSSDEWHWYDKSRLSFWLRYDTWPVELGLCLICDIEPEKSEELDFDDLVDMVNIKPEDKPSYALYKSVCLLSEDPIYKLEPKKHLAGETCVANSINSQIVLKGQTEFRSLDLKAKESSATFRQSRLTTSTKSYRRTTDTVE